MENGNRHLHEDRKRTATKTATTIQKPTANLFRRSFGGYTFGMMGFLTTAHGSVQTTL
jgi:hypothetical protein